MLTWETGLPEIGDISKRIEFERVDGATDDLGQNFFGYWKLDQQDGFWVVEKASVITWNGDVYDFPSIKRWRLLDD